MTAIIPTIGRASLRRAVQSVFAQRDIDCQVIVIADLAEATAHSLGLGGMYGDIRITTTGGGRGGGAARAIGVELSTTPWVAFLDDDDAWHPRKLERQMESAPPVTESCVLSCQIISTAHGREVVAPKETCGTDLSRYLFYRRRLSANRNAVHTSTILMPRWLASASGWRPDLPRHQDWDFLLRCVAVGAEVRQVPEPLVQVYVGMSSVSASTDWATSLYWAQEIGRTWPPEVYADFVAGQPLRYALQARDLRGIRSVISELVGGSRPSARALLLGLSGAFPRRMLVSAMHIAPIRQLRRGVGRRRTSPALGVT